MSKKVHVTGSELPYGYQDHANHRVIQKKKKKNLFGYKLYLPIEQQ